MWYLLSRAGDGGGGLLYEQLNVSVCVCVVGQIVKILLLIALLNGIKEREREREDLFT